MMQLSVLLFRSFLMQKIIQSWRFSENVFSKLFEILNSRSPITGEFFILLLSFPVSAQPA
ncbi:unnamed protein product [Hymenolepis diminuta]|uniref:Uncharacterized protein n=1 Tax=Hymenolepis diminuta TaxID=6216 RepID=A0A564Y7F3_HYMDI|nr:unnamed protein product [Hymenolepis diminuta]